MEALTAPDPIGCPPGIKPLAWGGTGVGCTISYTSIQAAINDPLVVAGWTVYVEAGVYHEQVMITKANITILGDPGDPLLPGFGFKCPIWMDRWSTRFRGRWVTIGEGVSLLVSLSVMISRF
jgi:hypothetical protein